MGLPVVRMTDADIPHCTPMVRMIGNPTVLVGKLPVVSLLMTNTFHLQPAWPICIPCGGGQIIATSTVLIGGMPAGRTLDPLMSCTMAGMGSINVLFG
jgi:hypothetical protein